MVAVISIQQEVIAAMGENLVTPVGKIYRKLSFENEFFEVIVVKITQDFVFIKWDDAQDKLVKLDRHYLLETGCTRGPGQTATYYYTEAGKVNAKPIIPNYKRYLSIGRSEQSLIGTVQAWREAEETPPPAPGVDPGQHSGQVA